MSMTKKQCLEALVTMSAVMENPEMVAVLENMLSQLEKPRKVDAKKLAAQDELKARILAVLQSQDKPRSIKELREMENGLGDLTSQKISPMMVKLVAEGKVEKTTEKRVSMFRYVG